MLGRVCFYLILKSAFPRRPLPFAHRPSPIAHRHPYKIFTSYITLLNHPHTHLTVSHFACACQIHRKSPLRATQKSSELWTLILSQVLPTFLPSFLPSVTLRNVLRPSTRHHTCNQSLIQYEVACQAHSFPFPKRSTRPCFLPTFDIRYRILYTVMPITGLSQVNLT